MNWVGGARSRLKVPNERKLQKEYFERKRLGIKAQDQTLDQTKAPFSKDLLFLSKAAENDYTDRSPRVVPNRVNLDSAVKHPGRDLELPMSPIEKPSTLDLDMADSSVVSSLNHSFYPPRLNTTTLPKVSTMKLPQGPVINDLQTNEKRDNVLNVSETLFPAMRSSRQEKAGNLSSTDRRMVDKKYSLDELLDSSQSRENHFLKQQLAKQKQAPTKAVSKRSDDLLWANLGGMLGRKRPASSNADTQLHNQTKRPVVKPKKDLGYDFSGWLSKLEKDDGSKMERIHDKEAVLEIHYAPNQPTKADLPKAQRVSSRENEKQSWPLLSTLLTENPFSNIHKRSQTMESQIAKKRNLKSLHNTALDESILGPIKKARINNEQSVVKRSKEKRSTTAFEKMMASFENSQRIELKDTELLYPLSDIPPESRPQKMSSCWKKFVSGDLKKKHDKPLILKEKKSMNCSAWEELTCLEQEAFAGLDTCTQELTLSPLDCTEEPLMRQVPDVTTKNARNMYQFDSSQDSFISSKSHSENHSQCQPLVSNETNPGKETKLSQVLDLESVEFVCPAAFMELENIQMAVPAFSNIVEVVSTTEMTTNDFLSYPNFQTDFGTKNSAPIPLANATTQTTPYMVGHPATKHQEQQTSSTVQCTSPLQSRTSQELTHTGKELKSTSTQAECISLKELTALRQEVNRLQKELGSAESTIVWQSLMLKIKDI